MVASHNTFTYLTPTKWWMKLLNFTAKCQSRPIRQQYEKGARVFDIRIKNLRKTPNSYNYDYGHTIHTYKVSNNIRIELLLKHYPDCYFRIVNEDGKNPEVFKEFCDKLISKYPNQIGSCISDRKTWNVITKGNAIFLYPIEYYSRKAKWYMFGIRCPRLESKSFKKVTKKEINYETALYWFDFI